MKSWKRAAGNAILVSPHRFNEAGAMEPRKWISTAGHVSMTTFLQ